MLLEHRADVNSCRSDGLTPLCRASKAGHTEVVQLLLQARGHAQS
jgi:ankyrin repeat protein